MAAGLAEPRPGRGQRTEPELGVGWSARDDLQQFIDVGQLEPGAEGAQQPQAVRRQPAGQYPQVP